MAEAGQPHHQDGSQACTTWFDERSVLEKGAFWAEQASTSAADADADSQNSSPEECRRRYVADKAARQRVRVLPQVFSRKECAAVLRLVERHASECAAEALRAGPDADAATVASAAAGGWHVNRHAAYATTDLPAFEVPLADAFVRRAVRERAFPAAGRLLGFNPDDFFFKDLFFVKYEAREGAQSSLELHRDGSLFSFNLLLNDAAEFDGGGTYFKAVDRTTTIQQGDCLLHDGTVEHAGVGITRGRRMLLVGFVDNIRSDLPASQRRTDSEKAAEWLRCEVDAEVQRAARRGAVGQVNVLEDALMMLHRRPPSPASSEDGAGAEEATS